MRRGDLEGQAPRLGRVAYERLIAPGVLLVVTLRRDGTPRLSPVKPLTLDGDLWLLMMWRSRKAVDLRRDDRVHVHSIVTSREGSDGEVKIRGQALSADDPRARARYCEAVTALGWQPEEPHFHLFRVDILDVTFIRYAPNGDLFGSLWPRGVEFVRRATSPTSVGAPEPTEDLFTTE